MYLVNMLYTLNLRQYYIIIILNKTGAGGWGRPLSIEKCMFKLAFVECLFCNRYCTKLLYICYFIDSLQQHYRQKILNHLHFRNDKPEAE